MKQSRKSFKVLDDSIKDIVLRFKNEPPEMIKFHACRQLGWKYDINLIETRLENMFQVKKYNEEQKRFILAEHEKEKSFAKIANKFYQQFGIKTNDKNIRNFVIREDSKTKSKSVQIQVVSNAINIPGQVQVQNQAPLIDEDAEQGEDGFNFGDF